MKKLKVVALLAILLGLNMILSGCLEEETKEKPIKLELIGTSHKIYAGDSTTFVIVVINNRNENDTITLSIADKPSEWDVFLNQTKINLTKKRTLGIFMVVNSSQDASKGDHKVKIEAISEVDDAKTSISINIKVIEEEGTVARQGDKVEVDYLGYLVNYKVFDTSIGDIARNSAIQKTSEFSLRSSYEPIKVYVGASDTDPSDPYGSMIEGFWEAIVGMRVGQSRTVVIPPHKGYGEYTNTTLNITEELTMVETMSLKDFNNNYTEEPIEGLIMKHHFWGWNVSIDYVDDIEDVVRILHEPILNQVINAYGWDSEVIYKNQSDNGGEGRILVEHYAEVGMKAVYLNCSAEVLAIEDDQIKLEYNISPHELGNEILNFDITLVDILD